MTWLFKLKMNDMRQFKNYRFIGGGGVGGLPSGAGKAQGERGFKQLNKTN